MKTEPAFRTPCEKRLGIGDVKLEMLRRERLRAHQSVSQRSKRLDLDVVISSNKSSDRGGQRRDRC